MRYCVLIALMGCGVYCPPNYTNYTFNETYVTPWGIQVDDPNYQLDPNGLDATAINVVNCLENIVLSETDLQTAWCVDQPHDYLPLKVKVPDWHVSCTGHEVFACNVPDASCEAKNEVPTAQCPCSCRAIIQDDFIVTAPNLELFPAQYLQYMTGCEQVWSVPQLAQCADPRWVVP